MKHQMRIVVSRPNEKLISIAEFKKLTLLERLQSKPRHTSIKLRHLISPYKVFEKSPEVSLFVEMGCGKALCHWIFRRLECQDQTE